MSTTPQRPPPTLPTRPAPSSNALTLILVFFLCAISVVALQLVTARRSDRQRQHQEDEETNLHLRRRIQHILTGFLFLVLSFFVPQIPGSCMVLIGAIILFLFHQLRLRSSKAQEMYLTLFGSLLRPHEKTHSLPGAFYFLLGIGVTFLCFELRIGRFALGCLALGDPMAALVGSSVKGPPLPLAAGKSISGTLACCFVGLGVGFVFLTDWREALAGAMVCALAEGYSDNLGLDDNLVVPVLTGMAVHCYSKL